MNIMIVVRGIYENSNKIEEYNNYSDYISKNKITKEEYEEYNKWCTDNQKFIDEYDNIMKKGDYENYIKNYEENIEGKRLFLI